MACLQEHVHLEHGTENAENVQKAKENEDCKTAKINVYEHFTAAVRKRKYRVTAQSWLQYCDTLWTLLMFQQAVKECE